MKCTNRRSAHLGRWTPLHLVVRGNSAAISAYEWQFGAQATRFSHSVVMVELVFWRRCTKQQPNQVHGRGCVEAAAQTFHEQNYTGSSSGSTKRPESPAFEAVVAAAIARATSK
jgi:hypothetical protein